MPSQLVSVAYGGSLKQAGLDGRVIQSKNGERSLKEKTTAVNCLLQDAPARARWVIMRRSAVLVKLDW